MEAPELWSLLEELPDDLVGSVLQWVRRDANGVTTVPGLLFDSRVCRRLCRRLRRISRVTPSPFDGQLAMPLDHALPRTVSGGMRVSDVWPRNSTEATLFQTQQCFVVRVPRTGRVWVLVTDEEFLTANGTPIPARRPRRVRRVLDLGDLVRAVSGQNANYATRMPFFDKVVAGRRVQVPSAWVDVHADIRVRLNNTSFGAVAKGELVWCENEVQTGPVTTTVFLRSLCLKMIDTANPFPNFTTRSVSAVYFADVLEGVTSGLEPPLSTLLGFREHPVVAECGGMQVGIHTHGLKGELLPRPLASDPEWHLRQLGRAALDRAERRAAEARALVVHESGRLVVAGPSGMPRKRPRGAAVEAREAVRSSVQTDNDVLTSGRFKAHLQDAESREIERSGLIDDEYADCDEQDEVLYDSDGDYVDGKAPRSRRTMAREEKAKAQAIIDRRAQALALLSDSDAEYDI